MKQSSRKSVDNMRETNSYNNSPKNKDKEQ